MGVDDPVEEVEEAVEVVREGIPRVGPEAAMGRVVGAVMAAAAMGVEVKELRTSQWSAWGQQQKGPSPRQHLTGQTGQTPETRERQWH